MSTRKERAVRRHRHEARIAAMIEVRRLALMRDRYFEPGHYYTPVVPIV